MEKALGPTDRKTFRDNYLAVVLIGLALFICLPARSQVDTTKKRQYVNGTGFNWKSGAFDSLGRAPRDTFKLAMADSGAFAYKGGKWWLWTGYIWKTDSGSGSPLDTIPIYNQLDRRMINLGGAVTFQSGPFLSRPAPGNYGSYYGAVDSARLYFDNGTSWIQIAGSVGSGGNLTGGDVQGPPTATAIQPGTVTLPKIDSNSVDLRYNINTTMAAIRMNVMTPLQAVKYHITGNRQDGDYVYDPSDHSSTDNTGLVLVDAVGNVYKRVLQGNVVHSDWFALKHGVLTDQSTGLQSMIDASQGYQLYVDTGTYHAKNLVGRSNSQYYFKGNLKMHSSASNGDNLFHLTDARDVMIEGDGVAYLDGNKGIVAGSPANGAVLLNASNDTNVVVRNMNFQNNGYLAVVMQQDSGMTVDHCNMYNTDCGLIIFGGGNHYDFHNNHISGGTSDGIALWGISGIPVLNVNANDNIIEGKQFGVIFRYASGGKVSGNDIDSCAIGIGSQSVSGVIPTSGFDVGNNTVRNTAQPFLGSFYGTSFHDNTIQDWAGVGMNFGSTTDPTIICRNIHVDNNHFINSIYTTTFQSAITCGNVHNVTLFGNTVLDVRGKLFNFVSYRLTNCDSVQADKNIGYFSVSGTTHYTNDQYWTNSYYRDDSAAVVMQVGDTMAAHRTNNTFSVWGPRQANISSGGNLTINNSAFVPGTGSKIRNFNYVGTGTFDNPGAIKNGTEIYTLAGGPYSVNGTGDTVQGNESWGLRFFADEDQYTTGSGKGQGNHAELKLTKRGAVSDSTVIIFDGRGNMGWGNTPTSTIDIKKSDSGSAGVAASVRFHNTLVAKNDGDLLVAIEGNNISYDDNAHANVAHAGMRLRGSWINPGKPAWTSAVRNFQFYNGDTLGFVPADTVLKIFTRIGGTNVRYGLSTGLGLDAGPGANNSFFGYLTGQNDSSGNNNTGIGSNSLIANKAGNNNTAFGSNSLNALNSYTNSSANAAFGYQSLTNDTAGTGNTGMGYQSGIGLLQGTSNIYIGWKAGLNHTAGNGNIVIGGNGINLPSATGSNQINIGNLIFGTNASGTISTIVGQLGFGVVPNGKARFEFNGQIAIDTIKSGSSTDSALLDSAGIPRHVTLAKLATFLGIASGAIRVGPLDSAAAVANGATAVGNNIYYQTGTASLPGLLPALFFRVADSMWRRLYVFKVNLVNLGSGGVKTVYNSPLGDTAYARNDTPGVWMKVDTTSDGKIRHSADSAAMRTYFGSYFAAIGSVGGGAGNAVKDTVTVTAGGFTVGKVLSKNSSTWVLADTISNFADAMVSQVINTNTFELTYSGKVAWTSGLTIGPVAYSSTTAGSLTNTSPVISVPVGKQIATGTFLVAIKRPADFSGAGVVPDSSFWATRARVQKPIDSLSLVKKDKSDSVVAGGYTTIANKNKLADSLTGLIALKKDKIDSVVGNGYATNAHLNKVADSLAGLAGTTTSGTYVPSGVGTNHISSVTCDSSFWIRSGNIVDVDVSCTATVATSGGGALFEIPLPVASHIGSLSVTGMGSVNNGSAAGPVINGAPLSGNAQVSYAPITTGTDVIKLHFKYRVY